ncbi:dipeptide epimerase [Virgibacillus proomii]|uniref:dipeptide epimerase n=1 Tax=Virgibacillus proomii TaxID=84407 RepID=UPI001C0FDCA9|nr:dipeptide epimerase [Virgibacillus proomii]MBU5268009.1 dipeptide epimerase [Virgibacillus proomii]
MVIKEIKTFRAAVPLHTPFKTALRTVTTAETVVVKLVCDNGITGWGEAPPTHVITGESLSSIEFSIHHVFKPLLLGKTLLYRERLFVALHKSMVGNSSAKAAIDMALFDCIAQITNFPLVNFLGGYKTKLITDYTVSVNSPEQMAKDAIEYMNKGFSILKIKVGKDEIQKDIERIEKIREQIGLEPVLRLDANQGWTPKEAVQAIKNMEERGLNIEFVEQPVNANDLTGLQYVTQHTNTPIMADEAVFTINDAQQVLECRACDLINIKLMKTGGIYQALKIVNLAEAYNVQCMVGSMIETKLGITAAAHFAASQPNVIAYDFDAPLMLKGDLVCGGIIYNQQEIHMGKGNGLGIKGIQHSFIV